MRYLQARAIVELVESFAGDPERERKCGSITLQYDFITGAKGSITIPCWDGKIIAALAGEGE